MVGGCVPVIGRGYKGHVQQETQELACMRLLKGEKHTKSNPELGKSRTKYHSRPMGSLLEMMFKERVS